MGSIIGEVIEGLYTGIKNITRQSLADRLEALATKIRRGDLVSDEAIEKANATLKHMQSVRDLYKDE